MRTAVGVGGRGLPGARAAPQDGGTEGHSARRPPASAGRALSLRFLSIFAGGGCLPVPTAEEPTRCLLRTSQVLCQLRAEKRCRAPAVRRLAPARTCAQRQAHTLRSERPAACGTVRPRPAGAATPPCSAAGFLPQQPACTGAGLGELRGDLSAGLDMLDVGKAKLVG